MKLGLVFEWEDGTKDNNASTNIFEAPRRQVERKLVPTAIFTFNLYLIRLVKNRTLKYLIKQVISKNPFTDTIVFYQSIMHPYNYILTHIACSDT